MLLTRSTAHFLHTPSALLPRFIPFHFLQTHSRREHGWMDFNIFLLRRGKVSQAHPPEVERGRLEADKSASFLCPKGTLSQSTSYGRKGALTWFMQSSVLYPNIEDVKASRRMVHFSGVHRTQSLHLRCKPFLLRRTGHSGFARRCKGLAKLRRYQ